MPGITGVVLDVDGTLVDSNDAHANAWLDALRRGGYEVPYEKVCRLIGMGSDKLLPNVIGVQKDSPEGKQITKWWEENFKSDYLPHIKAFPGAHDLLIKLHDTGTRMVVASSAEQSILEKLLELVGAGGLIEGETSTSEAGNSKPDPDIVQRALERLDMPKSKVVMLGDTPYDLEATKKAGIGLIAFRCGGWSDEDFPSAVAIYDGPADLLAHFDSSILAS